MGSIKSIVGSISCHGNNALHNSYDCDVSKKDLLVAEEATTYKTQVQLSDDHVSILCTLAFSDQVNVHRI